MPLLNICTITSNNLVIQVRLVFLSGEKETDYDWAMDYIWDIMTEHSIEAPSSIVTDRELALIKSLNCHSSGDYDHVHVL
jgi:hypothetical protein